MAEIEPDFISTLSPEQRQMINRVIKDAVYTGNGYLTYDHPSGVFSRLDPIQILLLGNEVNQGDE